MAGYWVKARKNFEWLRSPSIKRKIRTWWLHLVTYTFQADQIKLEPLNSVRKEVELR